ncbi:MAG: hypothetical protein KDD47_29000, partial [Acidobacteria bacterium]|nr:hypothetical protein [Acidobacteriota bacterium]
EAPFDAGNVALIGTPTGFSGLDLDQWPGPRIIFNAPASGALITLGLGGALANLGVMVVAAPSGPLTVVKVAGGSPTSYASVKNVAIRSTNLGTLTAANPVTYLEHTGAGGAFQYLTVSEVLVMPFASGGKEHQTLFAASGGTKNYLWNVWLNANANTPGYGIRVTGSGTKVGLYDVKLTESTGLPAVWSTAEVAVDPGNWVYAQASPVATVSDGSIRRLDRAAGEQAVTVADDGAATVPVAAVEPWQGVLTVTCQDADGCELALSTTTAQSGQRVLLVATSGTVRLPGGALCSTVEAVFAGGAWRTASTEGCP